MTRILVELAADERAGEKELMALVRGRCATEQSFSARPR